MLCSTITVCLLNCVTEIVQVIEGFK